MFTISEDEDFWHIWTEKAVEKATVLVNRLEKHAFFREHLRTVAPCYRIMVKTWLGFVEGNIPELVHRYLILSASNDKDINEEDEIYERFRTFLRMLLRNFFAPPEFIPEPPYREAYTISYLANITGISFSQAQIILQQVRKIGNLKRKYKQWHSPELFAQVASTGSLEEYETQCFLEYFGTRNPEFYTRLSFLCAFSLGRILRKYESLGRWLLVDNLEAAVALLQEPLVELFLVT